MAKPNLQPAFLPPDGPAKLYPGKVMHARLKPFGHRFNYRVFTCLFDLDQLEKASRAAWLFSVDRFNLISFFQKDHLPKDDRRSLRDYASQLAQDAGAPRPARILLLAYPRLLGFVFNPLSVYFCYDEDGALTTTIYEVRNTFGERHTYVCKVLDGQLTEAGLRQERTKIFYVSPFIDMGMRYHFRVLPPGDEVRIRIFETDATDPLLSATFAGTAKPFTSARLLGQLARYPLMTMKVVAGIHFEALKLWIKGAKFHSRGAPPKPVSYQDSGVAGPAE